MVGSGYLRVAYATTTPAVSVYLDLRCQPADGGREIALRWRALRAQLVAEGAAEADLAAIDERVFASNAVPRTLAAFARTGRLQFADELDDDFATPDAGVAGPLPYGIPLLRWHRGHLPYVVVLVDRVGGELFAHRGLGNAVVEGVIVGPDDEIERNAPGGWAQGRYQHRAEDSWAHNAEAVGKAVARMAREVRAEVVMVAGDVRAVQLLTDSVPESTRRLLRHVTTGVFYEGLGRPRIGRDAVQAIVRETVERHRAKTLARFSGAVAGKGSVSGVDDVVEALRNAAVAELLVVDQPGDHRIGWICDDPLRLSAGRLPPEEPSAKLARLSDAMVRAAFAQDADVAVVTPGGDVAAADGVAALLRF